jgi:UTP-glucose-1-phosphate uridylyltransferase
MKPIRKAIVPVTGLKTHLLPATKTVPASKQAMGRKVLRCRLQP